MHREASRADTIPELRQFAETTATFVSDADPERFWECAPAFARLVASTFIERLVAEELLGLVEDPRYVPPGSISPTTIAVLQVHQASLYVEVLEEESTFSRRLYTTAEHLFTGVVPAPSCGGISFEMYEQPEPHPIEVFDRRKAIQYRGLLHLEPGQVMRIRVAADLARRTVHQPVILLHFVSRPLVSLRWEYDPETLLPLRAIAVSHTSSRLEYTARMLAEFGDSSSIAPLSSLALHPDHFVRWAAIRATMKIDFDAGVRLLCAARHDIHPHVRNAAKLALTKIGHGDS